MKLKKIVAAIALTFATNVMAANSILQNEYIKAGVNEYTGTLGSGGNTSPGLLYNDAGSSTWNTGYDYLTPGTPFEGYTVRIEDSSGSLISTHTNNNAGARDITTGAWVGTPTASSAVWAASTSNFNIQHTYSLPSGIKYIDIDTRIEALVAMPKLWFGRFIDPDARAAAGDSSATDNVLGYGAISRYNVAFSEAISSRYALGLYSSATNVRAGITGWSTDPKDYYANGTTGYGSYTDNTYGRGDDTIGLGFLVSGVSIGDIINFRYAYIFGPSAFGAASSAVAGGAGGGTPGTVPGGGTLTDVGSATSAASTPSGPTVTGTTTTYSSTSTDTVGTPGATTSVTTNPSSTVQVVTATTVTPVTRTTVTTPTIVTTYSDSTTTTATGTPTTSTTSLSQTTVLTTTYTTVDTLGTPTVATTNTSGSTTLTQTDVTTTPVNRVINVTSSTTYTDQDGTATTTAGTPSSSTSSLTATSTRVITTTLADTAGTPVAVTTTTAPVTTRSGLETRTVSSSTVTTTTGWTRATTVSSATTNVDQNNVTTTSSTAPVTTTSALPDAVTATTTTTVVENLINGSLPIVTGSIAHHTASNTLKVQTIARETTSTVTTPMVETTTTTVVTDGVTVSSTSSSVLNQDITTTVTNDSATGRIDQHSVLSKLNDSMNRRLDMNAFRTDGVKDENGNVIYINTAGSKSSGDNGYNANSSIYGFALEGQYDKDFRIGFQYNHGYTKLKGTDSTTTQNKDHFGVYGIFGLVDDWKLVTNLAYANNKISGSRQIKDFNFSNAHTTSGHDYWLSNRVYTPDLAGFRPFAGYTIGKSKVKGYTETGSVQSALAFDPVSKTIKYAESGVRYDKAFDSVVVGTELSTTSDQQQTAEVRVAYKMSKDSVISVSGQRQMTKEIDTNTVFLAVNVKF